MRLVVVKISPAVTPQAVCFPVEQGQTRWLAALPCSVPGIKNLS
jgi:hypothetical protein